MPSPFRIVFVAGCLLSGTRLLNRVVCTSPNANQAVDECHYLMAQLQLFARFVRQGGPAVDEYFADKRHFAGFTRQIIERFLVQAHARMNAPEVLVLENSALSFFVPHLAAFLPAARFVLAVREPKDTIASMLQVYERHKADNIDSYFTRTGRDVVALSTVYNNHYVPTFRGLDAEGLDLRNRILFVRYEDLVRKTGDVAAELSRFCGVSLAHTVGDTESPPAEPADAAARQAAWSGFLTDLSDSPALAEGIGAYGTILADGEAAQIDQACEKARKIFHYT